MSVSTDLTRGGIRRAMLPQGEGFLGQAAGYAVVSGLALAADTGTFLMLTQSGFWPVMASIIGYTLGLGVHYSLSVRFVFDADRTDKSSATLLGEFAASGLAGLLITIAVVAALTDGLALPALLAKTVAVAVSFLLVFQVRRRFVFAPRRAG